MVCLPERPGRIATARPHPTRAANTRASQAPRRGPLKIPSSIRAPAACNRVGQMEGFMGRDDSELIRHWQRGDEDAFAALVRRWQAPVGRFLARLTDRADLAPDLCQEVFLRVSLARARYRPAGAFSPWLYRIALNVGRDALRRHRRDPQPLPDAGPPDPDDAAE